MHAHIRYVHACMCTACTAHCTHANLRAKRQRWVSLQSKLEPQKGVPLPLVEGQVEFACGQADRGASLQWQLCGRDLLGESESSVQGDAVGIEACAFRRP